MSNPIGSQSDPAKWLDDHQMALVETMMQPLRRRIMVLEGCLVYLRNFLPQPLKEHAESVLFNKNESYL